MAHYFYTDKNLQEIFNFRIRIIDSLLDISQNYKFPLTSLSIANRLDQFNSSLWVQDYNILAKNLEIVFLEFQKLSIQNVENFEKFDQENKKISLDHQQLLNENKKLNDLFNESQKQNKKIEYVNDKNEELYAENKRLSEENQKLLTKIDKLKKKKGNLKAMQISSIISTKEDKQLFDDILQLQKKYDEMNKKYNETFKSTETLTEENKRKLKQLEKLNDKNLQKKQKNKKLKSELENLKSENDALSQEITTQINQIKILTSEKDQYYENAKSFKKQLKKAERKSNNLSLSYNPIIPEKIPTSSTNRLLKSQDSKVDFLPYDLIINIDSLKSSKIGWELEDHKITESYLKTGQFSVVGLVGRENTGKTHLLNKLCGFDLPSGSNVNTKGLSLKYETESNLICLDSAGMQTPVYYYEKKLMDRYGLTKQDIKKNNDIKLEMLNDRTLTDIFIQDFILEVSEVIIIVVGALCQNDQKIIERINTRYGAKKKIIIIHNFSNLNKSKDIEKRIEKDIIEAFDVIERPIIDQETGDTGLKEYIERSNEKNKGNISHLVLGTEKQESGLKWNSKTLNYLKKILETVVEKKDFELLGELNNFIKENWHRYLKFKKRPSTGVSLIADKNFLKIETNEDYEVSNPLFNSLGTLVINPPFEVFVKQSRYVCLIEIPEFKEDSLKVAIDRKSNEFSCLVVQGTKKINKSAKESYLEIIGARSFGDFMYRIPLGPSHLKTKWDGKHTYKEGVLKIKVDIDRLEEQSMILN